MARPAPHPPARRLDPERLGDHVDRLFAAAWALCGDREEAEDLVQETFARVLARPRWLRREDDVGYLLRALRNTYVSRLRARDRRPATASLEVAPEVADPRAAAQPLEAIETGELFRAIARLTPPFRDAIVAIDVAGLSYREAARALRVKEATMTTRLHRARRQVVAALEGGPR
ncbi:MAG TPA: RNA polymerase sigma factor [Capillimicrobium sp.]|nr:RNA polymerase sigma factor [Capillimicrobium sp.]